MGSLLRRLATGTQFMTTRRPLGVLAFAICLAYASAAFTQEPRIARTQILSSALIEGTDGQVSLMVSGRTVPGGTDWTAYPGNSVTVRVDLRGAGFAGTPLYFTSLGGTSTHYSTTGATSIYKPGPDGFDIYLRAMNSVAERQAKGSNWHINWVAIGTPLPAVRRQLRRGGDNAGIAAETAEVLRDQKQSIRRMRRQIRRLQRAVGIRSEP